MLLNVGDLQRSATFYQAMGMTLTADIPGQTSFLPWDGYHHHLGINLWEVRYVHRVGSSVNGLDFFKLHAQSYPWQL
jgi:catechol 2,3-dioxygenase